MKQRSLEDREYLRTKPDAELRSLLGRIERSITELQQYRRSLKAVLAEREKANHE